MAEQKWNRCGPLLWLGNRSRRFWMIASIVAILAGYPLSFGPAIWLTARGYIPESAVQSVYMPFLMLVEQSEWLESAATWWGSLGVPDNQVVTLFIQSDDADHVFQFTRTGEEIPLGPVVRPRGGGM